MNNPPKVAVLVGSLRKESYNKRLAKAIGHLNLTRVRKIPLENMRHDIGGSGCRLIRRQRLRQLGIENRENRAH